MSKYFDETLGANNPAAFDSTPRTSPIRPPTAEFGDGATTPTFTLSEILPISRTLRFQFAEADGMGVFQESYRSLRTRLLRLRAEKGLRSVAVTSAAKGEGKSLTSLNLAYSCAQLPDVRVLLIDADIRSGGLTRVVEAPEGPGVSDILAKKASPEQAILPTDLPNLHFLRAGLPTTGPAELLASRGWVQLMDWCSQTFSLVIVDTPPILNFTDVELITAGCDGAVLVVRSQETRVEHLQECAKHMDPKKLIGVVLNAAHGHSEAYKYGYAVAAQK